jgi:hypothetical protein
MTDIAEETAAKSAKVHACPPRAALTHVPNYVYLAYGRIPHSIRSAWR